MMKQYMMHWHMCSANIIDTQIKYMFIDGLGFPTMVLMILKSMMMMILKMMMMMMMAMVMTHVISVIQNAFQEYTTTMHNGTSTDVVRVAHFDATQCACNNWFCALDVFKLVWPHFTMKRSVWLQKNENG